LVHHVRAFGNVNPVGDAVTHARGAAITLAVFLRVAAKVQVQFATNLLVLQYVLVDRFMADTGFAFLFQPAADLFGTPLLFQHRRDAARQFRGQLDGFGFLGMPLLGLPIRLLVTVAALPRVAGEFSAEGRLGAPPIPCNSIQRVFLMQSHFDIVPILKGEACVSHKQSRQLCFGMLFTTSGPCMLYWRGIPTR
jgi:hypothetical protein